jgi:O-antigen/teichoic acid export membrane protein
VSLRVATSSIAFLFIGTFSLLVGYPGYVAGVIAVVGAAKCVESFSDVLYGLFQKHERFDRISISLIVRSSASLIVVIVVVNATGSVLLAALSIAITWSLILVFYDVNGAKSLLASHGVVGRYAALREWGSFDKARMGALARLAFPMGIVMLLVSLNMNIPRLIIERDLGIRQLGYFGAMAYPVLAGSLAVFALGESTVPRLSRDFITDPRQFVRVWCRLLLTAFAIGVFGVTIVVVWGSDLLRLFYGSSYEKYGSVFAWFMVGAGFSYLGSASGYALTAARWLKIQVLLFAIVAAATLVGALLLIPRNGLIGAGQAMAISGLIHAVLAGGAAAITVVNRMKTGSPDVLGQIESTPGVLTSLSRESLYEV